MTEETSPVKIKKIGHVVLSVSDIERSTKFWTEVMGFKFSDKNEVGMVTRRLFRSGESEYAINKVNSRLKDVVELFLGTGVGSKAYSIVEQGKVDELVNSKPEERRGLIEEAAGTSKYKSRKVLAEKKLERTQQNLLRVADIVREIERQIRSMKLSWYWTPLLARTGCNKRAFLKKPLTLTALY